MRVVSHTGPERVSHPGLFHRSWYQPSTRFIRSAPSAIRTASRCQQVLPRYRKSRQVQKSSSTTYSAVLPSTTKKSRYFLTLPASMAASAFCHGSRRPLQSLRAGLNPKRSFPLSGARDRSYDRTYSGGIIDILPAFAGGEAAHGRSFQRVMRSLNAG